MLILINVIQFYCARELLGNVKVKNDGKITLILVRSKNIEIWLKPLNCSMNVVAKLFGRFTADNDSEFISWDFLEYVQKQLKIKLYYATPSAPHQRGLNESRNHKLRDWYPKCTSFEYMKQQQLDEVAYNMNCDAT